MGFTEKEQKIMDYLTEAHTLYTELEQTHPSDMKEWIDSLYSLQKTLSMRILRRDYPDDFPSYNK